MVTIGQIVLSTATVVLSVLLSGFFSWRISKGELEMEYEWERYSDAEEWCDDYIRLIRELQANFEYKHLILKEGIGHSEDWMPGEDLDEYGMRILEHSANRPVLIFNLIGEREKGETGISDRAGDISQNCGILADENLRDMGEEAPKNMDDLKENLFDTCERLIDEIMELRNEDLQADFKD
jgi:hypothetical protein